MHALLVALIWPLLGLRRFLARPKWWPKAIAGGLGGLMVIAWVGLLVAWFRWPAADSDPGFGDYLAVAGSVIDAIVTLLALLLPFTKVGAGRAVLRSALAEEGVALPKKGGGRGFKESLRYLLLTLGWRVFWIAVVWVAMSHSATLGTVTGVWAIGHLVALDACDHTLAFHEVGLAERRWKLALRSPQLLVAGAIGGMMVLALSVTVVGWLLWGPAMFVGAARWIATWREFRRSSTDQNSLPNSL